MRDTVMIFGGDGYIGWPLALNLAWGTDDDVVVVDNLVTRRLVESVGSDSLVPIGSPPARLQAYHRASGKDNLTFVRADARDPREVDWVISKYQPQKVVHLAQQRSAPFSMIDQEHALYTELNNVATNLNIVFSMTRHVPEAHLLKMGTMGEYGTPNIEITEGPVEIRRNGRRHMAMFPRAVQSWYHLSKIFDTFNVMLANKVHGLRATDVMQGVVYGSQTEEIVDEALSTRFDLDSIWGTVINKYVAQAVVYNKLLIYGRGRQTRGYLSLYDSVKCLSLLLDNPPSEGEYRVVNQIDETFDTVQLAEKVKAIAEEFGYTVGFEKVRNPRVESEAHYYKVQHKILPSLGFSRTKQIDEVIREIFQTVTKYKPRAMKMKALLAPSVTWSGRKKIASDAFQLPRDLTGWPASQELLELAKDQAPKVQS
ncbi:MAG: NAD-dependent epimerase/dehydratase family protein [Nitrososphaerota archaeon]|jgi:nucleoside-diphosphate-sugar epimerase|nr:NAD-dependent epimerase/dehydratase family protein [Nitrososphaerota archaeon]MDG6946448.1 NAD-dependent epimerase/dehydratase family protein [Nitrososphaerota archaeon]MDG6947802.1 NAD-dependent epimerase/dehydratase family protein [Nitrososphaerota archaeon]